MNTNQSSGGAAGPMSTFMPMNIDAHPLEFTGSGGEYFRVWIVNVLLSIVTLGIYTPWARRRTAQYFYSHTLVAGSPLEFTAQQRKMVMGFVLLMLITLAYNIAANTGQDAAVVILLLTGAVLSPLIWGSAGDMAEVIQIRPDTNAIAQEGQTVFRWATTQIAPIALRAVEAAGLTPADIDVLVPHQANLRIIDAVAKRLRKAGARDDMRVAQDIVHSGNTSSASIPLAVDHMRAAGEISRGDVLLLVGFGAGLSYAGQVVICP